MLELGGNRDYMPIDDVYLNLRGTSNLHLTGTYFSSYNLWFKIMKELSIHFVSFISIDETILSEVIILQII